MTRDEVVAVARTWIGKPYKKRGRTEAGIDCIGLAVVVSQPFNIPYEDLRDYSDYPHPDRLITQYFGRYCRFVLPHEPFPGTIGIFTASMLPVHVGIFSMKHGQVHFIHARGDMGTVIEQHYRPEDRQGRLVCRYAFPGLED